jgi:hypothetical protein
MCDGDAHVPMEVSAGRIEPLNEDLTPISRRSVLLAGLAGAAFLAGCGQTTRSARSLPGPAWDAPVLDRPRPLPQPSRAAAESLLSPAIPGVIARTAWTTAAPDETNMDRMLPIRYITVHHDAQLCYASREGEVIDLLERIRQFHRSQRRWADIGYHFAIDRAGRVWEGRPLAWQGAHVRDHNEGNIGVMLLGNFDEQRPTDAQLAALRDHLVTLQGVFGVPVGRVKTHQEWSNTRCPGQNLQSQVARMRRAGQLA